MRVVIVGAGAIAYQHARACQNLDGVELGAVCDVRPEAAESADLAIVCTWGASHREVTEKLARSGRVRGILCEKPIAQNAADAEAMARVAAEQGVLLAEAFRLRHQPIHHRVKELIAAGRIGEVRHVRNAMMSVPPSDRRRPEVNWRFDKAAGGGVTYDIGCYCINHARWVMDAEPEAVHAFGRWGERSGVDEHVVAVMEFPGGRTAEWCVSWQAGPRHAAEVYGSKGMLRLERAWGIDAQGATAIEIVGADGTQEREDFPPVSQFGLQIQHMQECLETGQPHRIPPSDSVAQMRVIDAVYESLRTGQAVRVGGQPALRS